MQSIGLVFKAIWAPAEAMFLTAKNPRVLGTLIVLVAFSLESLLPVLPGSILAIWSVSSWKRLDKARACPKNKNRTLYGFTEPWPR